SIVTPFASVVGDPAKTRPSTTASATSESRRKRTRRRTRPRVARTSEDEELDAARDVQLDAGDVGGEVGAEEGDRVRDVLRLTGPLEDRSVRDPLVHGRAREVKRLGTDDPRDDGVGGDPVPAALHRERLRQAEESGLRRRVRRLPEAAER